MAVNPPSLVGEPLYQSLKVRLMGALGGLNAVQSCEVGDGVHVISRRGSENNDPIRRSGYQANSHGGLIGGMTTGSPLVCRVGFKPTSTIHKPQQSVRKNLEEIDFALGKRAPRSLRRRACRDNAGIPPGDRVDERRIDAPVRPGRHDELQAVLIRGR